jgi:hypothetical protein
MRLIPQPVHRTISLPAQDGREGTGGWEKLEYEASIRQNQRRLRDQQNAEYREILDHILGRLGNTQVPGGRRTKAPLDKVEVFKKYRWHGLTLKEIVTQVKRSIGSIHGSIKELERKIKLIILQDYPELALEFGFRPGGPQGPWR